MFNPVVSSFNYLSLLANKLTLTNDEQYTFRNSRPVN